MESALGSEKKLLTQTQAAEKLAVSLMLLESWNTSNVLSPEQIIDGQNYYSEEQISLFLKIRQLSHDQKIAQEQKEQEEQATAPVSTPKAAPGKRHFFPLYSSYAVVLVILLISAFALAPKPEDKTADVASARQEIADAATASTNALKNNLANQRLGTQTTALQETPTPFLVAEKANVHAEDVTTLASVAQSNNTENVIDGGKIKGNANETLATTLGGVESMAGADTIQQVSVNPISGMVILTAGLLSVVLLFPKRYAFAGLSPKGGDVPSPKNIAVIPSERVIEVNQKTDGTIILDLSGKEYKISKPELYSESDQFFGRLMELIGPGTKEIDYVLASDNKISLSTPLSRLATRLGFVGIKRDLFFPRTSKDRVLFRKYLTAQDLVDMNINEQQVIAEITAAFEARSTQV
ncbi:MAG: hypothetical protein ACM3IJ_04860 [Candidatus Levyibacteriota bacterium]